jgi:hypothetical protein
LYFKNPIKIGIYQNKLHKNFEKKKMFNFTNIEIEKKTIKIKNKEKKGFSTWYNNKDFSDIQIKTKKNQTIYCHKVILSKTQQLKELITNIEEIKFEDEKEEESFIEFTEFLYKDELNTKNIIPILLLCQKYEISLKKIDFSSSVIKVVLEFIKQDVTKNETLISYFFKNIKNFKDLEDEKIQKYKKNYEFFKKNYKEYVLNENSDSDSDNSDEEDSESETDDNNDDENELKKFKIDKKLSKNLNKNKKELILNNSDIIGKKTKKYSFKIINSNGNSINLFFGFYDKKENKRFFWDYMLSKISTNFDQRFGLKKKRKISEDSTNIIFACEIKKKMVYFKKNGNVVGSIDCFKNSLLPFIFSSDNMTIKLNCKK